MKKYVTATKTLIHLTFEHATSDQSKQLRSCLYKAQNYQFQYKIVIGTSIENLFIFSDEKKINQLKASKIPRSFPLT